MTAKTSPPPTHVILAPERRIGNATAKRESWRRAEFTEKYVEACQLVEALQAELRRRRRVG
jgi:hypothetical protein